MTDPEEMKRLDEVPLAGTPDTDFITEFERLFEKYEPTAEELLVVERSAYSARGSPISVWTRSDVDVTEEQRRSFAEDLVLMESLYDEDFSEFIELLQELNDQITILSAEELADEHRKETDEQD